MTVKSNFSLGIYPGDIIIRTAILKGMEELRQKQFLLDFIFQALLKDETTKEFYGEKELLNCKQWFIDNEVPVTMGYHMDNIKYPHVTIWLGEQQESDKILGDINEHQQEEVDLSTVMARTVALTFTPVSFDSATGTIVLPKGQTTEQVFPGMRVLDTKNSKFYLIEDVIDERTFKIEEGVKPNLTRAQVCNANDLFVVTLESIKFKETYKIEVSVMGDATKCIILHAIMVFILNRHKEKLLEGRGFERSTITSTGIGGPSDGKEASQFIFSRIINLNGVSTQYWPKEISPAIQGVQAGLKIADPGAETGEAIDELEFLQGWETV